MTKRLTNSEYIKKCSFIHSNKYDYSKTDSSLDILTIICPLHGEFYQKRGNHISGRGCQLCAEARKGENQRLEAKRTFIPRLIELHDNLDFSKTEYINKATKVIVTCKIHKTDKEDAMPGTLLRGQGGCDLCSVEIARERFSDSFEEFLEKARKVHHDKYDYDKENYEISNSKINIFCKIHKKEFPQTTHDHLSGCGCPTCGIENRSLIKKEKSKKAFIEYQKTQSEKYNYDKAIYETKNIKVEILCLKHQFYFWQSPAKHMSGQDCPTCADERHPGKTILNLNEEQKNALCSFYYLKFIKEKEIFYKVGITNDLKTRVRTHKKKSGFDVKVLYTEPGTYLSLLTKEQSILKTNENKTGCPIKFPGHTECFSEDILGLELFPF